MRRGKVWRTVSQNFARGRIARAAHGIPTFAAQGVILQSLVIALRYAGAIDGEDMEAIKDFGKTNIKPILSPVKTKLSQLASKYATPENAKAGAKAIKATVYDDIPGLQEDGREIEASVATASQKWNYLSTHASEFSASTWEFLTMAWEVYKQV